LVFPHFHWSITFPDFSRTGGETAICSFCKLTENWKYLVSPTFSSPIKNPTFPVFPRSIGAGQSAVYVWRLVGAEDGRWGRWNGDKETALRRRRWRPTTRVFRQTLASRRRWRRTQRIGLKTAVRRTTCAGVVVVHTPSVVVVVVGGSSEVWFRVLADVRTARGCRGNAAVFPTSLAVDSRLAATRFTRRHLQPIINIHHYHPRAAESTGQAGADPEGVHWVHSY